MDHNNCGISFISPLGFYSGRRFDIDGDYVLSRQTLGFDRYEIHKKRPKNIPVPLLLSLIVVYIMTSYEFVNMIGVQTPSDRSTIEDSTPQWTLHEVSVMSIC